MRAYAVRVPLPQALRHLAPDRMRDAPRLRAFAVGRGIIPPRTMHTPGEAAMLSRLATGRRTVVEIGVYEGASAVKLCDAIGADGTLHLIDPFGHHPTALRPGQAASEHATRRVVERAAAQSGTRLAWHIGFSADVARAWDGDPCDFVFVDGDHSEAGCRLDWDLWHPLVASRGLLAFHDARMGAADGRGHPGPTAVADKVLRPPPSGWVIQEEAESLVVARRDA
jgi:predicted O-methyltransferase YrrM